MIFVVTDKVIGPIQSWDTTHLKGPIQKMFLTDKFGFYKELSGFDYYYMEKEALGAMLSAQRSGLVKETIYGIRDFSEQRAEILFHYNNQLKTIMETHQGDGLTKRLEKCKEVYDVLLKQLSVKEVTCISLCVIEEQRDIKNTNIDSRKTKKGQGIKFSTERFLGKGYQKRLRV